MTIVKEIKKHFNKFNLKHLSTIRGVISEKLVFKSINDHSRRFIFLKDKGVKRGSFKITLIDKLYNVEGIIEIYNIEYGDNN